MFGRHLIPAIASLAAMASAQTPAQDGGSPFVGGMLICSPNSPGTPESARPVMERFGAYLTQRLGRPCQPVYFNRADAAQEWLRREPPRFAILSLDLYLRWREELRLEPIAQSERAGEASERLHVVVRGESTAKALADLLPAKLGRQPVLWSSHLEDPRFATRVAFAFALRAEGQSEARLVATHQPLKVLRKLKAGEGLDGQPVDAVVVDEAVWRALQQVPDLTKALREVHVTAPLPTPPVVAFPSATAEDRARAAEVLIGMKDDPEGKELLSTLQITGFRAPDAAAYQAAVESYAREAP